MIVVQFREIRCAPRRRRATSYTALERCVELTTVRQEPANGHTPLCVTCDLMTRAVAQRMVDDATAASQDNEDLQALGAHLEHIRIYEANILEAEHRSL